MPQPMPNPQDPNTQQQPQAQQAPEAPQQNTPPEQAPGMEGSTPDQSMTQGQDPNTQPQESQAPEKYSAQMLRRLHEDREILLQEYDEMLQHSEHEEINSFVKKKLQNMVREMDEIEDMFQQHHPELEAPGGGNPQGGQEETPVPEEEGGEGSVENQDTADSQNPPEEEPEEAAQAMRTEKKSLNGWGAYCKKMGVCPECGKSPCACSKSKGMIDKTDMDRRQDVVRRHNEGLPEEEHVSAHTFQRGDRITLDPEGIEGVVTMPGSDGFIRVHLDNNRVTVRHHSQLIPTHMQGVRGSQNTYGPGREHMDSINTGKSITAVSTNRGWVASVKGHHDVRGKAFRDQKSATLYARKMYSDDRWLKNLGFDVYYEKYFNPSGNDTSKVNTQGMNMMGGSEADPTSGPTGNTSPVGPNSMNAEEKALTKEQDYELERHHRRAVGDMHDVCDRLANKETGMNDILRNECYYAGRSAKNVISDILGEDTDQLENVDFSESLAGGGVEQYPSQFPGDLPWVEQEGQEQVHQKAMPDKVLSPDESLQNPKKVKLHHLKVINHAADFLMKMANERAFGRKHQNEAYLLYMALMQIVSDDPPEDSGDEMGEVGEKGFYEDKERSDAETAKDQAKLDEDSESDERSRAVHAAGTHPDVVRMKQQAADRLQILDRHMRGGKSFQEEQHVKSLQETFSRQSEQLANLIKVITPNEASSEVKN